jgi:hypothetical protein
VRNTAKLRKATYRKRLFSLELIRVVDQHFSILSYTPDGCHCQALLVLGVLEGPVKGAHRVALQLGGVADEHDQHAHPVVLHEAARLQAKETGSE